MKLFSADLRRKMPAAQYWKLYDSYSQDSLQLDSSPSQQQMLHRLEQLTEAETRFGFVYDAEKGWLSDVLGSSMFESYPDWLLSKLNQRLQHPLLWGVHELVWPLEEDAENAWSSNMLHVDNAIPFNIVEDEDIEKFKLHFITMLFFGTRDHPCAVHLVHAFKSLFNAPYHLLEIKQRLLCKDSIGDYFSITINHTKRENPGHWSIELSNHYGSWEGIDFEGREAIPYKIERDPVREAFHANQFPEWQIEKCRVHKHIPPRLINNHRHSFDPEDYAASIKNYGKYAYLRHPQLCSCGEESLFYFQFHWGQLHGFTEYELGDEILWDGFALGYPELEDVYVVARADGECPACKQRQDQILIYIKNNRVHSLEPEILEEIKYPHQSPFVSKSWVPWEDFEVDWLSAQWSKMQASTEIEDLKNCRLPDFTDSSFRIRSENIEYLYLISKYRHSIPIQLFKRCVTQIPFSPYRIGSRFPEVVSLNSELKVCAILRANYNEEECLIKFYWGSILDFPEYEVGDIIQWSNFSVGDELIEDVVYARGFVDGSHDVMTIIEIRNNKIVDVRFNDDKPEIDDLRYNSRAYVFYGDNWLPWKVVPDFLMLKPRRQSMFENH